MTATHVSPPHDPYARIPYTSHAYAESHPDRLRVVARVSGWNPPRLEGARVLEVGCGRGGNLLAMGVNLPGAELVGVERSERQAAEARAIAERLGLANVTIHAKSFADEDLLASAEGSFDFVIAHGLASWVTSTERTTLLSRMARWLSPNGVGYVSFNVLPGWYDRLAARDWLRFASGEEGRIPGSADALGSLRFLRDNISPELGDYCAGLTRIIERLAEADPAYLVHEYMAEEHHPLRVTDFLREAETAGLAYLGDAIPANVALETAPESVQRRAAALSVRAAQQLVDFVRCTAFRRALFVRKDKSDARDFRAPSKLDARVLRSLRLSSRLRPRVTKERGPTSFVGPNATLQATSTSVEAALLELFDAAPRALTFDVLLERTSRRLGRTSSAELESELCAEMLDLWLSVDGIDLHDYDAPFTTTVSEKPEACPFARHQARAREPITNRWHQEVVFAEAVVRDALTLADGTRTALDIARALSEDEELVRASFILLAKSALVVG